MDKNRVSTFADDIARQYNPEGISPFPYEKIQQDKTDLKIFLVDYKEDISGLITYIKEEETFYIIINKNKPQTRQNFTIAHEVGHYFLHKDIIKQEDLIDGESSLEVKTLFRLDSTQYSAIETEANIFAASLIMPTELVKKAWETFHNIEECAKLFSVSPSAMSIRLEKLNLLS